MNNEVAESIIHRFVHDCRLALGGAAVDLEVYVAPAPVQLIRSAAQSVVAEGSILTGTFTDYGEVRTQPRRGGGYLIAVEFNDNTTRQHANGTQTGSTERVRWTIGVDATMSRVEQLAIRLAGPDDVAGAGVPASPRPLVDGSGAEASADGVA